MLVLARSAADRNTDPRNTDCLPSSVGSIVHRLFIFFIFFIRRINGFFLSRALVLVSGTRSCCVR